MDLSIAYNPAQKMNWVCEKGPPFFANKSHTKAEGRNEVLFGQPKCALRIPFWLFPVWESERWISSARQPAVTELTLSGAFL